MLRELAEIFGRGLMFAKQTRCPAAGCKHECISPWLAAILVFVACTVALFAPFLSSIGVTVGSRIALPTGATWLTPIVILIWVVSVLVGCARRHEQELTCLIDSLGIPGVLLVIFYSVK